MALALRSDESEPIDLVHAACARLRARRKRVGVRPNLQALVALAHFERFERFWRRRLDVARQRRVDAVSRRKRDA